MAQKQGYPALWVPFHKLEPLRQLQERLSRDREESRPHLYALAGGVEAGTAHLACGLGAPEDVRVLVTADELAARRLTEECAALLPEAEVFYFPAKDLLFYGSDVRGNELTRERLLVVEALKRCADRAKTDGQNAGRSGKKKRHGADVLKKTVDTEASGENAADEKPGLCIVTTMDALMNRLPPLAAYDRSALLLVSGEPCGVDNWRTALSGLGYEAVPSVSRPGEFSLRGGIVDVFPLTAEIPLRIELWGDLVDTIRLFDPQTQVSLQQDPLSAAEIPPASEAVLTTAQIEAGLRQIERDAEQVSKRLREHMQTEAAFRVSERVRQLAEEIRGGFGNAYLEAHLTYFCPETACLLDDLPSDALLVACDPGRLLSRGEAVEEEFSAAMERRLASGDLLPKQADMLYGAKETLGRFSKLSAVCLLPFDNVKSPLKAEKIFSVRMVPAVSYNGAWEVLVSDLKAARKRKESVLYLSPSRTRAARLSEELHDEGLLSFYTEDMTHPIGPSELMLSAGGPAAGFSYPEAGWTLITETDVFGERQRKKRRVPKYSGEGAITSFSDLAVGDYVVHENRGVGIFRGMTRIRQEGVEREFLKLEYAKGDHLYIPVSQMDLLQKYGTGAGHKPKLSDINSAEWSRTKEKVQKAVGVVAHELVELYADRQQRQGYRFAPDTPWQREFEETFPFQETEGQLAAIEAVKRDMESGRIMDRLICGDVGYGKTEIAVRAAFKAVQENKQVALLAPTTILAQQHYNTFVQRMGSYPVRIGLLSRFVPKPKQKEVTDGLAAGAVDIVIGTHRLLSSDVAYKDLGLLIIDEEQRFGVRHKEKIKQMRRSVDVLALSATPIPRTLHMSLVGIRDMSLLEEAPADRVPIQTYVFEYNEELVREAILRELARGGQVYYVFNRVKQIADMAARVQALVPEAAVSYAHGQMPEERLSDVMNGFINGETDVLVSTTIIEIGLDISNVNTIIIHDSDRMGLSQLYQLRGRVGRSSRTAYAFFMYRRDKILKEVAEKRLSAIREFTDLGSGFKIAMRDLEIRGAGNLLGEEQSGHIAEVGYDLYCKLLNAAVRQEQGERSLAGDESQSDSKEFGRRQVLAAFDTALDLAVSAYLPEEYVPDEVTRLELYRRIAALTGEKQRDLMLEELIDRFGSPPKPVQELLWASRLRQKAHEAFVTELRQRERRFFIALYPKALLDPAALPSLVTAYSPCLLFNADTAAPSFELDLDRNSRVSKPETFTVLEQFLEDLSACGQTTED